MNPTITQVRNQLANLYPSGNGSSSTAQLKAAPAGAGANGSSPPLSRAAVVTAQAEAAAREVNVSRRQADAQRWIAAWRSRSRGNLKAAAAAVAADQQQQAMLGLDPDRISQVGAGPDLSALQPMQPMQPPWCRRYRRCVAGERVPLWRYCFSPGCQRLGPCQTAVPAFS